MLLLRKNKVITAVCSLLLMYSSSFAAAPTPKDEAISDTLAELGERKIKREPEPFRKGLERIIAVAPEPGEEMPRELDSYMRYAPKQGASAQSGKVGIIVSEYEYSSDFKLFEKLPVQIAFGNRYIGIENSTAVKLPAHLTSFETDLETTLPFFGLNNTYLRLGVHPSFYSDNWSAYSSAFRIPSRYFAIYTPNDRLTLILGVAVYPDYHNQVFPIAGFIYKPNERLVFDITPKRPNISYALTKNLSLFGEGSFDYNEFEVTKDGYKGVVLAYYEKRVGGGIRYRLNKHVEGSISVGDVFGRTLKYYDSLGKVKIRSGLYTEFRLHAAF